MLVPFAKPYTSGRLLLKNTALNFLAQFFPLIVGLFAIPKLIGGLGVERFGILTLAWAIIGYSSLFDLGLGRALTKVVAERIDCTEQGELGQLIWTGLLLMWMAGAVGAAVMIGASSWLIHSVLKVSPQLQSETIRAFQYLALSIPIVILTAGLRGVLEANQLFALVTAVRLPLGILTFAAPWLLLAFSHSLVIIVIGLLLIRWLACIAQFLCVLWKYPVLLHGFRVRIPIARLLLGFGGWMTVTNVISPIMTNSDRFLVGAIVSVAAVAYYTTPYEMITKLWLIPFALAGVLFPAFSSLAKNPARLTYLLDRGVNYVMLLLFLPTLFITAFARIGMRLWLGASFAVNSALILQLLCLGVFLNSISQIPFALIQGIGRPDLTAKLHFAELPLYLSLAYVLIREYGVKGAAIAWLTRVMLDGIALCLMATRVLPSSKRPLQRASYRVVVALGFCLVTLVLTGWFRTIFVAAVACAFMKVAWSSVLGEGERKVFTSRFKTAMMADRSHVSASS